MLTIVVFDENHKCSRYREPESEKYKSSSRDAPRKYEIPFSCLEHIDMTISYNASNKFGFFYSPTSLYSRCNYYEVKAEDPIMVKSYEFDTTFVNVTRFRTTTTEIWK